ncbi:MAG: glycogen synthase GlgA [Candidatus Margulisiibacteriota bacterium]
MKILFVSSEMAPFCKTGGLADVAGSLPKAIKSMGHDIRAIIPKYKMVDDGNYKLKVVFEDIQVKVGDETQYATLYETKIPGTDVIVYLIGNENYFGRDGLYQENGRDFADNARRFIFFCKAVLAALKKLGWEPHVMHLNDWQTALIAAYIKTIYSSDRFFHPVATVYSVHNMGYLGLFSADAMLLTGLSLQYFTPEGLEFWNKVSFAKAGFVYSDVINTVSKTYAKEIQTPEFGHGLDGLLRARSGDVYGILNGIDNEIWDPSNDSGIAKTYSSSNPRGKGSNKLALQKASGFAAKKDAPVIGLISRLANQKGLDILAQALPEIMRTGFQFVALGAGDQRYESLFRSFSLQYKGNFSANIGFDSALAQQIYAGSDLFMMPSRYEPCGLGQLISFKYGTIPIVRKTGGLADTVFDYNPKTEKGDGFVFDNYSPSELLSAVKNAYNAYKDKKKWSRLVKKVMEYDFSWDISAKKYITLYKKAIEKALGERQSGI